MTAGKVRHPFNPASLVESARGCPFGGICHFEAPMRRETPEEKVRREQRELIARLNAARDAQYTTAQQNQMRMAGSPPMPAAAAPAVPQGQAPRTLPLGGMAGRAQDIVGNRLGDVDLYMRQIEGKRKATR